MANVIYEAGNALYLPPDQTFDVTSIVAKRVGAYINYYSFGSDGTMFVIHSTTTLGAGGLPVATVVGWNHFSGADLLQSGTTQLPLQPLLDIMNSRNPSSTKAFAWLMGTDDTLIGSTGADLMKRLGGNDTMDGGLGNDKLLSGIGNDLLQGDQGRDVLQGQAGNDTLVGGLGKDALSGGVGADVFLFHSALDGGDKITDFAAGTDHIGLDAAGFGLVALVDGINFVSGPGAVATSAVPSVLYDFRQRRSGLRCRWNRGRRCGDIGHPQWPSYPVADRFLADLIRVCGKKTGEGRCPRRFFVWPGPYRERSVRTGASPVVSANLSAKSPIPSPFKSPNSCAKPAPAPTRRSSPAVWVNSAWPTKAKA